MRTSSQALSKNDGNVLTKSKGARVEHVFGHTVGKEAELLFGCIDHVLRHSLDPTVLQSPLAQVMNGMPFVSWHKRSDRFGALLDLCNKVSKACSIRANSRSNVAKIGK